MPRGLRRVLSLNPDRVASAPGRNRQPSQTRDGPPHFHVRYTEQKAIGAIESPTLLDGELSPRALGLMVEFAALHRQEGSCRDRLPAMLRGPTPWRVRSRVTLRVSLRWQNSQTAANRCKPPQNAKRSKRQNKKELARISKRTQTDANQTVGIPASQPNSIPGSAPHVNSRFTSTSLLRTPVVDENGLLSAQFGFSDCFTSKFAPPWISASRVTFSSDVPSSPS